MYYIIFCKSFYINSGSSAGFNRRAMRCDFFQTAQLTGVQQMHAIFMVMNAGRRRDADHQPEPCKHDQAFAPVASLNRHATNHCHKLMIRQLNPAWFCLSHMRL